MDRFVAPAAAGILLQAHLLGAMLRHALRMISTCDARCRLEAAPPHDRLAPQVYSHCTNVACHLGSFTTGSEKANKAPPPGLWDAQSLPPCASISLRQIAKPTPRPLDLVE